MSKLQLFIVTKVTVLFMLTSPVRANVVQEKCTQEEQSKQQHITQKDCKKLSYSDKKQQHWMESLHQAVSDSVYHSALWFDDFFLEEGMEQESPKTTARIRLGWEPEARDWAKFDTRFRVKVKLPHFKNKADLIFSDDDDNDQSHLPLESINTKPHTDEESFSAALRYTHRKSKSRIFESRIGISGGDIFFRIKHDRRITWNERNSIKIDPSVYYFLGDGLGAKLLLEYDYQVNAKTQLRINYSVRGSAAFSGLRWKHGAYYLRQIDHSSASITALQVEGERNGENGFMIDNYRLSHRYRFNALRSWLFFEIEPFLEWPEEQHYTTTPGIALRVEGYFSRD
ncbi:hypothetical protein [Thalassotalea sp. PP2-459]|uniref:hypothetical protein n=1 Tax=Thalassotalea sp. PP2-459 TaxID=1742724 RepID=UPI000941FD09|nr:hypothetical protein [Thalassotalea sp. PP2-459]OKY27011.1 hypothetical protein BI291_10260 [Thalassotalea sp. PP2-459]